MLPRSLVTTLCAIGAVAFMTVGFTSSYAQPGANVVKDFGCGIAGFPIGAPGMFTTDSHSVVTRRGNTQFKCTADIPPGARPHRAVREIGIGCNTPGGFTGNSTNIYTPGGKAHLICTINPSR